MAFSGILNWHNEWGRGVDFFRSFSKGLPFIIWSLQPAVSAVLTGTLRRITWAGCTACL